MLKTMRLLLICVVSVLAATAAMAYRGNTSVETEARAAQDVMGLERRISSIEQRFYSLESNLNQIRQQMMVSQRSVTPQNIPSGEVERLRAEVQLLQERIREVECAAVKLDERTLTPAARAARRAGGQGADPCRLQTETPVQLSTRPR
jgi:hypothetical protein